MENEIILKNLNEKQVEAVRAIEGPVLILAGAGSGKTKALTHRIAFMIASGIRPENILAVTFTNKAAGEMKTRLEKLLALANPNRPASSPMMGTFHSVCARILRRDIGALGYTSSFSIFDYDDQLTLIKRVMEKLQMDPKRINPKSVLAKISTLKSSLIGPEEFSAEAQSLPEKNSAKTYVEYQKELKNNNAVDFDDLMMLCVRIFTEFPATLEKYQNIFKYILIDEYQDTNHAQYVWANLLAKQHRNLFVIGDDYQSIYAWRQADITNILDFEKDYPEAKVIKLEQNYRSTKNIIQAANTLIKKNRFQKEKNLWTDNEQGQKIFLKELADDRREGDYLIQKIKESQKAGFSLNDMTILYRTHAQSRSIEETMLKYGLPYRMLGGIRFYERREVKDILAYMRLALNPDDNFSFERIVNVPLRGIGKLLLAKLRLSAGEIALSNAGEPVSLFEQARKSREIGALSSRQAESLSGLASLISVLHLKSKELPPSELVKHILKVTNYQSYISDKTPDGEERWENVKEILTATKKYDGLATPDGLVQFLEEVSLVQETDKLGDSKNAVNLMTLHSVKGLEFPVVFIAGMEEGLFPHSMSMLDPQELEEERRLCYVGITRAKKQLHMTFCRQRMLYGSAQFNPPSRFLFEIPEDVVEFSPFTESGLANSGSTNFEDEDFIAY
ncbi:MAG: UvrD-helicase domain-containing protein [bacterium]|nr:UvrD-helicase domain-containing protein [bacterium]